MCGQSIASPEKLEEAKQHALDDFNQKKASELEANVNKGQEKKTELESLQKETETLKNSALEAEKQLAGLETDAVKIQSEITAVKSQTIDSDEYKAKLEERAAIEKAITNLQNNVKESVDKVRGELQSVNQLINSIQTDIAKFDQCDRDSKRIEELQKQQKLLAAEYENLQGQLFMTEEFVKTKVNLFEEKINSKFKFARFKMFEQQINGGISDTCETLYNGVPYSSGLNNGHRIIVGLDIISTLSEHYKFSAPIFIDNQESVTRLPEVKGQIISLIVSAPDKVLRVEYPQKLKEAVK
jgi:DNA repair exonuclease SbcCD ATPase subunit